MIQSADPLQTIVKALRQGADFSDTEIADILWLASQITPVPPKPTGSFDLHNENIPQSEQEEPEQISRTTIPKPQQAVDTEIEIAQVNLNEQKAENKKPKSKKRKFTPRPRMRHPVFTGKSQQQKQGDALTLHLPKEKGVSSSGKLRGVPITIPAAEALPNKSEIIRSLRPLFQQMPSKTNFILDENQTINRIAELNIWIPVWKPARSPWLDITIIVDSWSSMAIWEKTIDEFYKLLLRSGAFGNVSRYILKTNIVGYDEEQLYSFSIEDTQNRPLHFKDIVSRTNRKLTLILSDCTSPAWEQGDGARVIELLSKHNLVTIVNLLPEELWEGSTLVSAVRVNIQTKQKGAVNKHLGVQLPWYWTDRTPPDGVPVPMITLEPEYLNSFAKLVSGHPGTILPGYYFPKTLTNNEDFTEWKKMSSSQQFQHFRETASPTAQLLAGYLAVAPLNLPVMRLVQQTMLPKSRQVHLAEVFRSGLIRRITPRSLDISSDKVRYEFIGRVRDILLDTILEGEVERVLQIVSTYIDSNLGRSEKFRAVVYTPVDVMYQSMQLDEKDLPFAMIATTVFKRLGLRYQELARHLETAIQETITTRAAVHKQYVKDDPNAPKIGDVRSGKIVAFTDKGMTVSLNNVNYDAVIPKWALFNMELEYRASLKEDEEITVKITRISNNGILVAKIVDPLEEFDWEKAQKHFDNNDLLEVTVRDYNGGGLIVSWNRLSGFIPNSHLKIYHPGTTKAKLQDYKARQIRYTLLVKIIEVNQQELRLIFSEIEAQKIAQEKTKREYLEKIEIGDVKEGIISNIVKFGLFVTINDLDGFAIDGLVHVSEIARGKTPNQNELNNQFSIGEKLQVMVIKKDLEKLHIMLSLKNLLPDAWESVETKYSVDSLVAGEVIKIKDYGGFVELEPGIEALVHVSEIPNAEKNMVNKHLTVGETRTFRILSIDTERQRIGLSLRLDSSQDVESNTVE